MSVKKVLSRRKRSRGSGISKLLKKDDQLSCEDKEFLVMKQLFIALDSYRYKSLFAVEKIVDHRVVKARVTLSGNHPFTVNVLLKKGGQPAMISKSNSSELTAFLGYDVVQGQLLKLNNLLKERIEERVKGYRNEMLGIKLTKEIISEHKLPLRVKSTSKLDLQGVDFLVTTKRDSFIPFQIKSSAIDIVKEFYKSEKINVLVIDGNKEVGEIKQNIWSIIKDFCILKKIPYV